MGNVSVSQMEKSPVIAIAGAGASGLMAAISALHAGARVILLDRNDRPGAKIYATGNGRCNLSNRIMTKECYYSESGEDILRRMEPFGPESVCRFFTERGILLHERNGYLYPRTDQASTVVSALVRELRSFPERLEFLPGIRVSELTRGKKDDAPAFCIRGESRGGNVLTRRADRVILASGGMVSKEFGCTGDGYRLAMRLGHTVTPLFPCLVPLVTQGSNQKAAAGVRTQARVTAVIDGKSVRSDTGEVQFTERGISGIPVFQISHPLSEALAENAAGHSPRRRIAVRMNFLPELSDGEFAKEAQRRLRSIRPDDTLGDLFAGLIPAKLSSLLIRDAGFAQEKKIRNLGGPAREENPDAAQRIPRLLLDTLRQKEFIICGTEDFHRAQVTGGGIPLAEVDSEFASRVCGGLYLAGELLDTDGICGGYNLTFAFSSGWIAGRSAAAGSNSYVILP